MLNVERLAALIRESVERLGLDLRGFNVLTEAGSNYFAATPVIAAVAGAKRVTAVTKSTSYGSFEEIERLVGELASRLGVEGAIEMAERDRIRAPEEIDILTNLGHLRPLDAAFLSRFDASRLVIPYMCEKWEYRPGDLDLEYCRQASIPVAGTNESHPDVDAFASCGVIAAKLLTERDFELRKGRYAVLSPDAFGEIIADYLSACGADVVQLSRLEQSNLDVLADREALVIANYTDEEELIGNRSVAPALLRQVNPALELILVAGVVDATVCAEANLLLHPSLQLPPKRMTRTLAYAGPRPMIDLHAAGLKVGELLKRKQESTLLQVF